MVGVVRFGCHVHWCQRRCYSFQRFVAWARANKTFVARGGWMVIECVCALCVLILYSGTSNAMEIIMFTAYRARCSPIGAYFRCLFKRLELNSKRNSIKVWFWPIGAGIVPEAVTQRLTFTHSRRLLAFLSHLCNCVRRMSHVLAATFCRWWNWLCAIVKMISQMGGDWRQNVNFMFCGRRRCRGILLPIGMTLYSIGVARGVAVSPLNHSSLLFDFLCIEKTKCRKQH